jgi:dipeptidyl aminopeptidase/acylaminoacyl peptidase
VGRALELEDVYRLTLISDPVLSPDGAHVVYVVTKADAEQDANQSCLWLVATDDDDDGGAAPRRLTNGPGDASPRWSPDGRSLLFVRPQDGKRQVWRLPVDGGEPEAVTSMENGVGSFAVDPSGTRLAVSSVVDLAEEPDKDGTRPVVVDRLGYKSDGAGLVKTRRSHLFVVALDGRGEPIQLTSGDYSVGGATWSPDGATLAFATAKRDDRDIRPGSAVFTVADDGGDHVQQTDDAGTAAAPQWLDNRTLLYAGRTDGGLGHTRLYALELGGEPKELTPGFDRNVMLGAPAYPGSLPRTTDDGHVLFCARDRGCTHLYRVPTTGGTPERLVGDAATTASSITVAGDRVAYVTASPTSTGEVAIARVDGANTKTLTSTTTDGLDDVDLLVPSDRTFTAPDGVEVHGWVLRSEATTGPSPLLLDVHGGPHNAWNPTFDGIHLYHQALAAQGWTILFVNPRGSDGYGEDFYTAVIEGWGTADLDDFLTPIQALVDEGIADPARLAVTGYSYGGFMTCWLTSRTDRFAAAVTGGCVTNQVSLFGTSDLGWFLGAKEIGATPTDEPKRLHEHSPITYVGDVTAPTLVLHGENDDRCPIEQAEQWFASLRAAGVPTRMVRYPGGSHLFIALGRPSHRLDYNRRVVEWLNEHVPIS